MPHQLVTACVLAMNGGSSNLELRGDWRSVILIATHIHGGCRTGPTQSGRVVTAVLWKTRGGVSGGIETTVSETVLGHTLKLITFV